MKELKSIIIALIAGLSAITCVILGANMLAEIKEVSKSNGFLATGSASQDFTSDLIVWRGSFSAHGATAKEAYEKIKKDSEVTKKYLLDNGVTEDELIFYSVNITQALKYEYYDQGNVVNQVPDGYDLSQELSVTSGDVDKIDSISRDITKLIDAGVEFNSNPPEYYYTKLDELKLKMIDQATQNAKSRIDLMAQKSGSRVGKLLNANLGVFQITAKNSSSEDYSYGGNFNTSSKEKTASITVKLNYTVK